MSRLPTSFRQLWTPVGLAALLTIAPVAPSTAQIVYPAYPPVQYVGPDASVKFDVKPKVAAVYVDGFYAGVVDDFDGMFQRLYAPPGGREITLYLEGYRTYTERVYLSPDRTFKIHHMMEKLAAGEVAERPPAPAVLPPDEQQGGPPSRGPAGRGGPPPQYPAPPPQSSSSSSPAASGGTLELNLQPGDADVLVDGQPWRGTGQPRLTIDLSEGRHNIQIRKTGYVGYLTDVQIRRGETTTLDVNLRIQPETPR